MPMLDVFRSDAFSVIELTKAMELLPYAPARLDPLFPKKGVSTTSVTIEYREGKLSLLPVAARGTMPTYETRGQRKLRSFLVPHIPANDAVMADEVQGVRAFGSETDVETVSAVVNEKLAALKQDHELTWEYHRIGALQGEILDADGTTVIYNLFDEFGLAQYVGTLDPATDDIKAAAMTIIREMESRLGATPYTRIRAICGDQFWDDMIANTNVKDAWNRFQDNSFARTQQDRAGFNYADITWENYRGKVGSRDFIAADKVVFYPEGVPNLFQHYMAPANFIETVNTNGRPTYAKQETMRFDIGIELHTQSNPLMMCHRPGLLLTATPTGSSA